MIGNIWGTAAGQKIQTVAEVAPMGETRTCLKSIGA
jgi:hypothetical protein